VNPDVRRAENDSSSLRKLKLKLVGDVPGRTYFLLLFVSLLSAFCSIDLKKSRSDSPSSFVFSGLVLL
jgi:hypothetical protein